MSRTRFAVTSAACLGCFALVWACSGDDTRVGPGGDAGSGASAGSSGSGGSGGSGGSDGGGGGQGGVIDTDCNDSRAFLAPNAVVVFPTPRDLATSMNTLLYRPTQSPLGIVLVLRDGRGTLVATALEESASGAQVFPEGMRPDFVAARADDDGFGTTAEQQTAYLRLIDESGPVFLELQSLTLSAIAGDTCSQAQVTLNAIIPESQGALELQLPDRTVTIAELVADDMGNGGRDTGEVGWPLALTFAASSTDFDFSTL